MKKTFSLIGIICLLTLSFIYTNKVFSLAKENDPIMKDIVNYKKKHDINPIEPTITSNVIKIGTSGKVIDVNSSYKNMKEKHRFDENKIIYKEKLPKNTINNNYSYYIKNGNNSKKNISIIFKVNSNDNLKTINRLLSNYNIVANFFVDETWLSNNLDNALLLANNNKVYNLGSNGTYSKSTIKTVNNLIESITLDDSIFCLNENQDVDSLDVCKNNKMYTIMPTLLNPSISDVKKNLDRGIIIAYDLDTFNISNFKLLINTITSRNYKIVSLDKIIKE